MDPYLEAPDLWPDFHDRFASHLSAVLNVRLPAPYYARLEMRPEVGILGGGEVVHRIVPDVAVAEGPSRFAGSAGAAVLDEARTEISRSLEIEVPSDPLRHHMVEIRDGKRGHELVTLIEIVSPANKRPGDDRKDYEDKQREIAGSTTSLIEIDLLRGGSAIVGDMFLRDALERMSPRPDYVVVVSRAWRRRRKAGFQYFPFTVRETLPCIPVPLREGETEVPLDLQFVLRQAYDSGPYVRGAVDYALAPSPPLADEHRAWAEQLIKDRKLI
jgi:hypothetical protein